MLKQMTLMTKGRGLAVGAHPADRAVEPSAGRRRRSWGGR